MKAKELKRRDLSGIFIFDTFPGEERRKPTCIEDCQQETRCKWCMSKTPDYLREAIKMLADQVDFFCDKVVLLADACGVTKHKEEVDG